MARKPLAPTQWRYCVKVGLAAGLGYLLTQGGQSQYAIYSAFSAALVVGASVGEDLATSGNRVKGTLAGMLAGMAVSAFFDPSAVAIGVAVATTALVAVALGWGVPVARVGATLCIVTLVAHRADALEYDVLRAANTLIGIAVGLAVSFLVWPVRARGEQARTVRLVLEASARLHDALGAVVKASREGGLERRLRLHDDAPDPRGLQIVQLGFDVLATALAAEGHAPEAEPRPSLDVLRRRLEALRTTSSSSARN